MSTYHEFEIAMLGNKRPTGRTFDTLDEAANYYQAMGDDCLLFEIDADGFDAADAAVSVGLDIKIYAIERKNRDN